ncbi:LysR family transcriptional regulator [bacterium M00.F.Ca.ET.194.01.1.1]|nr:LysR family transcriptional regulator [bacterium M00.F.Ca.ET.194.01.1.1]TGS52612.1 LysR family transcriptional regulator [bacterium M00.F.Ca.ET.179.01.1.1]TGV44468.1 LysR family transcriptional regulator [bacterium M00.F.Ca.ET.168.01.1.1]
MLDYLAIEALDTVIRTGTFQKAAEALHISASAVSQRIAKLELKLSARLIIRGTPCRATDEAMMLMGHLEKVRQLECELVQSVPEIDTLLQPNNRRIR